MTLKVICSRKTARLCCLLERILFRSTWKSIVS